MRRAKFSDARDQDEIRGEMDGPQFQVTCATRPKRCTNSGYLFQPTHNGFVIVSSYSRERAQELPSLPPLQRPHLFHSCSLVLGTEGSQTIRRSYTLLDPCASSPSVQKLLEDKRRDKRRSTVCRLRRGATAAAFPCTGIVRFRGCLFS